MRCRVLFLAIFILPLAFAKVTPEEYRKFLMNLGFEDYPAQIAANRKAKTGISPVADDVLAYNQERLQIFNWTRELAIDLMQTIENEPNNREARARLVDFAARMLALQPLDPPKRYSDRVLGRPKSEREDAMLEELTEVTRTQMTAQVEAITTEIAGIIFPIDEIEKIHDFWERNDGNNGHGKIPASAKPLIEKLRSYQKRVADIVTFMYLDSEMGQTRYLGRALAACIAKYSHDRKSEALLNELRKVVHGQLMDLDNFLGDTLAIPTRDSKEPVRVKVHNGDPIMVRSMKGHDGETTWAPRPAPRNSFRAFQLGVFGHWWDHMLPDDEIEDRPKNLKAFLRSRLAESDIATNGVSHAGLARVCEDPKTGYKMPWAVHNHPNDGRGAVSMIGIPDQFAIPGPMMRFAIVHPDAEKFYEFAMEQVARYGYRENLWRADAIALDDKGEVVRDEKAGDVWWKAKISREEFDQLNSITSPDEYLAEVQKRAVATFMDYMTKDGIGFATGFTNFHGLLYCSHTVLMAYLQSSRIDLQGGPEYHDRWNTVLQILDRFGSKITDGLDLSVRVVSPAGFLVQPWAGDIKIITFPPKSYGERVAALTIPTYVPVDAELARHLADIMPEIKKFPIEALLVDERIIAAINAERSKSAKRRVRTFRVSATPGLSYMNSCAQLLRREVEKLRNAE